MSHHRKTAISIGSVVVFVLDPQEHQATHHSAHDHHLASKRDSPQQGQVIAATQFALTVPEFESRNGLGLISCQDNSNTTGEFLYSFYNQKGDKVECDIASLCLVDEKGKHTLILSNTFY